MEIRELYKLYLCHPEISTDSRKISKGCIYFALRGEKFDGNKFAKEALAKGAIAAVVDDLNLTNKEGMIGVADVLETLQALARFHRSQLGIPVLSITGSNGKTTTKELVRDVLSQKFRVKATSGNLNNHIGVPLTILSTGIDTEFLIVEMGANHQGEIAALCDMADPDYVMITNIGKAHLEGFGGVEGIKKGKSEMYRYAAAHNKKIFLNTDDAVLSSLIPGGVDLIRYSVSGLLDVVGADPFITFEYDKIVVSTSLFGDYNLSNLAFAVAAGHYFGVETKDICRALENYNPENNRSQVTRSGSTIYIMDAYNANPSSMKVSLDSFSKMAGNKKLAILGDMLELGEESEAEHRTIVGQARNAGLWDVIFIGDQFYNVRDQSFGQYFRNVAEARPYFSNLDKTDMTILLKGSRGTAVEKILDV